MSAVTGVPKGEITVLMLLTLVTVLRLKGGAVTAVEGAVDTIVWVADNCGPRDVCDEEWGILEMRGGATLG